MKIVLDTNVLISSVLNPEGNPAKILNLVFNGKLIILFDNRILSEYFEVLKRDKFGFPLDLIYPVIDFIKNAGIFVTAEPVSLTFKDEDDKKFYEVFKSGEGEYLITGNLRHYPKEMAIISPAQFIERYK